MSNYNFPGWNDLSKEEKDLAKEILKTEEIISEGDEVVEGDNEENKGLRCKIKCKIKLALQIAAAGGNPALIALAYVGYRRCRRHC